MKHALTRRRRTVAVLLAGPGLGLALLAVASAPAGAADQVFTSDGTFLVPAGVAQIGVSMLGANGGGCTNSSGGLGASVAATLSVTAGETLRVHVGGAGHDCPVTPGALPGGANGGGAGGPVAAGSGGGSSDVRSNGDLLADRLIVAGGGGGSSEYGQLANGGNAGDPDGAVGAGGCYDGGGGGTQSAGGAAGQYGLGVAGSLGIGGDGGNGGGGGGGYYGGGGGGDYASGGGGSSWVGARLTGSATFAVTSSAGAGSVTISWTAPPPTTTTTAPPTTATVPVAVSPPNAGYGIEHSATLTTTIQGSLQITGSNWMPGTAIDVTVHSDPVHLGTITVDASGAIDVTFTLPAEVIAGDHLVALTGTAVNGQAVTLELVLGVTSVASAQIAFTC